MLIGFTGLAGSGKNAACDALIEDGFNLLAFADPLREMAEAINPIISWITVEDFSSDTLEHRTEERAYRYAESLTDWGYGGAKTQFPEFRAFLQRLGTEAGRKVLGENVWVDASMQRASEFDNYCWSDVRFLNEAAAIRDRGGFIVRIERPGAGLDGEAANHASETELASIEPDHIIQNTGTLAELHREVRDVVAFFEHSSTVGIY